MSHKKTVSPMLLLLIAAITGPIATAQAQLVQVRPGYVRAPFVRVYTNPDGSSYVRAPFVAVGRPPWQYAPPRFGDPSGRYGSERFNAGSTRIAAQLELLSWQQLREEVQTELDRFVSSLENQPNAAGWYDYLQTETLGALVGDRDEPPIGEELEQLTVILGRYQATLNTPEYPRITSTPGFRQIHALLEQLVMSPELRQRRRLAIVRQTLEEELARINAPAGWETYLRIPIPEAESADPASDVPAPPLDAATTDEALLAALTRFERVRANPDYVMISSLPGFQATYEALSAYLGVDSESAARAEELPVPAPQSAVED